MASEYNKKRISEKVGTWDKFTTLITPGDVSEKERKLLQIADRNEEEEKRQAQLEAIKKRRFNTGE